MTAFTCGYFDAHACRSCGLIGTPYRDQLAAKEARARAILTDVVAWDPSFPSPPSAYRNKAKFVVGGTTDAPTLGILDLADHGVDLRHCGIHTPGIRTMAPALADVLRAARIPPYSVPDRSGEAKHVLVTESPDGDLLVRFVLRSPDPVERLAAQLDDFLAAAPAVWSVTVNVLPEHRAVLEGDIEIPLTGSALMSMRMSRLTLFLSPGCFFQTNTTVADALYTTACAWIRPLALNTAWDLYCGVGGFALHLAATGAVTAVLGVEVSAEAITAAREAVSVNDIHGATFVVADADTPLDVAATSGVPRPTPNPITPNLTNPFIPNLATTPVAPNPTLAPLTPNPSTQPPDLVVVNPPRRGIGSLATQLEAVAPAYILYSSCHIDSLATDLARLPHYRPIRAQVFDMFPQTTHSETLVLLERHSSGTTAHPHHAPQT